MTNDPFGEAVKDVPEEQRRLLEKMGELGLVTGFAWDDTTHRWAIQFTGRGRDFLRLIYAVAAPEPAKRRARLLALDALAEQAVCIGGFSEE